MSQFYDQASLVMVPSGYKDGKLYSQKPLSTSGELSFSRGSDIEATRVNANGYIEKAQVNLLLQSNQFDTTWVTSVASVTGGQADKDGGSTAWLLSKTASFGRVEQSITLAGVYSFSVYAKAGTSNWIAIGANASLVTSGAFFDLGTGAVGSKGSNVVYSKITALSGGWYRCEAVINNPTENYFRVYVADANGDVIGISGNIYIQDAQLNYGLVAQDYQETTTAAVVSGITDNMPRLNYDPANPTCPSLLLEPSRTNSYLHSDYLYNFNGTVTFNNATSPEGVQNATLLTKTSASDQFLNLSWSGTTISASSNYTMSIFVKHNGDDVNVRYEYNNSNDWGAVAWTALFEVRASGVTASTVGNCTSDVEDYGSGWYRLKVFVTSGASITASSPSNLIRVIGASGETVLVYGAQLELGGYVSSMVPTYGSSATRLQDSAQNTSASSIIGQTEGTIFAQVGDFPKEFNGRIIAITQDSNNYITILKNGNYNDFYTLCAVGGASQMSYQGTGSLSDNAKIAVAYANNDFVIYVNGTQVHTDTSASVPTCSNLFIGKRENGTVTYSTGGSVSQALLFPTRLSNADLATLTSL